jgi:hypothetical protein
MKLSFFVPLLSACKSENKNEHCEYTASHQCKQGEDNENNCHARYRDKALRNISTTLAVRGKLILSRTLGFM